MVGRVFLQQMLLMSFPVLIIIGSLACDTSHPPAPTPQPVPQEVDARVLSQVVPTLAVESPTTVYRYPEVLQIGDVVSTIADLGAIDGNPDPQADNLVDIFAVTDAATYFYFIDHHTGSFYEHFVEYVFVEGESMAVTRIPGRFWPFLNGGTLFYTTDELTDAYVLTRISPPSSSELPDLVWDDFGIDDSSTSACPSLSGPGWNQSSANGGDYVGDALIINGIPTAEQIEAHNKEHHKKGKPDPAPDPVRDDAEAGVQNARNALKSGGYSEPTVIDYADEPPEEGNQTKQRILDYLNNYLTDGHPPGANAREPYNLLIYIVSHSDKDGRHWLGPDRGAKENALNHTDTGNSAFKEAIKGIHDRAQQKGKVVHIKLISDGCYGGVMVYNMFWRDRISLGLAAAYTDVAWEDVDPGDKRFPGVDEEDDPNAKTDTGPEFSSGLFEDYKAINDLLKGPCPHGHGENCSCMQDFLRQLSQATGIPEDILKWYAAYASAVEKDATICGKQRLRWKNRYKNGPRRYPVNFDHDLLKKNGHTEKKGMKKLPDWIEVLLGRMDPTEFEWE